MKFQFLSPKFHGLLDYAAAGGLIVLPFLLNLGADSALALWFSVAAGFGLIGYSLLTDYTFSAASVFSYNTHLALDLAAAGAFVAAPFLFGFGALATGYYIVMALGVIAVVAVSDRPKAEAEADAQPERA